MPAKFLYVLDKDGEDHLDRVRKEVLHARGREISCTQKKRGRLAALVTYCIGTAFQNTLLKER